MSLKLTLTALPVINSSQAKATNEHGLIVGQWENGLNDPYLNIPATSVVAWAKGKIFDLGTLGGYQGATMSTMPGRSPAWLQIPSQTNTLF